MKRIISKPFGAMCLSVMILVIWAANGTAFNEVNKDTMGVAIKGYDTVAYWTQGRAVKGNQEFSHTWNDAEWLFASVENRDLFASDPDHYAPQYGGH